MFSRIRRGLSRIDRWVARRLHGANALLDARAPGLPDLPAELASLAGEPCRLRSQEYAHWLDRYLPGYVERWGHPEYKKGLELYASFTLLAPAPHHVYLDVAAGGETYASRLECRSRVAQDLRFDRALRRTLEARGVRTLECDAASLPLMEESVDRISVHHAIEHFQGDSDIRFFREAQRVLRRGGVLAVVPLLVTNEYVEVTSDRWFVGWDPGEAGRLFDPSATLPGGPGSGDFARLYDAAALERRILRSVDRDKFTVTLHDVLLDGRPVPDMSLPVHRAVAAVNRPYRALLVRRVR